MRKSKLKFLASLCIVTTLIGNITVFAVQPDVLNEHSSPVLNSVDEISMLEALQEMTEEELEAVGYTNEDIKEIAQIDVRELLFERAQYTNTELSAMGYTDEQIEIFNVLRNDPNNTNVDISLLSANCTGEVFVDSYNSEKESYDICYHWEWSSIPLTGLTDVVAMRWLGVDESGGYIDLISSNKFIDVSYYYINTGKLATTKTYSATTDSNFNSIKSTFPQQMAYADMANDVWAKGGYLYITLKSGGSSKINYLYACIKFAHSVPSAVITPSLSYKGAFSFNITPTVNVKTMDTQNVRIAGYRVIDTDKE